MFIDYLTLMLINMVAGFFLLAGYLARGIDDPDQQKWVPGFGIVGVIALAFGAHMTMTWPLIGQYNSAFGEMSVFFGAIFLGTAVALARGWNLLTIAIYALFAGLAAILLGARIINLGMTQAPLLSGFGFITAGIAGVLAAPILAWFRHHRAIRLLAGLALAGIGLLWALTGYLAYWSHMEGFKNWKPTTMIQRMPSPLAQPVPTTPGR